MDQATHLSSASPAMAGKGFPPTPDLSNQTLGDFLLLRRIGQGGMGQVYLAEQISLKRKVAIKIMRPDLELTETTYQRFRAEAEAVARISHANIVQVYAFGVEKGLHYMALEYVEGRNLRDYLDRKGPPDTPQALSILRQVAAALQRASELSIIHRDIKPENILLTRRGEVKVADFGLSRCFAGDQAAPHLTQSGVTLGTPLYMSPEQIQGLPVDPRTDIYSLGVTCYHMLAGKPPFRGQTAFELAVHHVKTEPRPLHEVRPDLPAELCALVHKMMAKDPVQRYQSCNDLLKDVARLRENLVSQKAQGTEAGAASLASRPPVKRRRWQPMFATVSIFLALVAGGSMAWLWNHARAAPSAVSPPDLPSVNQSEQEKREKFLREAVEQYANPRTDRTQLNLGLNHSLELGLLYLKQDRLDDAEQFFRSLINNSHKVRAYQVLGELGEAVVLARRDKPMESNKAFRAILDGQPGRWPGLLNQPQLRYAIGLALDRNKTNATTSHPFPAELERWRKPPQPPWKAS
jgi:serine/threonine-protein kinase